MSDSIVSGPVAPTPAAVAALRPLGFDAVRLGSAGLFGDWQRRNAAATLPHCIGQLENAGNLANLRRVTGDADRPFTGMWFADSDVYKTLEAAAWQSARLAEPDAALRAFRDSTAALLAKAQDDDGYLNSFFQVDHRDRQWRELRTSHELYCAGHLIQAAVAAARADRLPGGDGGQLLAVARSFADLLVQRYGAGGTDGVCGHPEIETALVELYRLTGNRPYLDLAARFIDLRGRGLLGTDEYGPQYYQDHAPVRDADEATGHVVRQNYLLAGVVDVAVETGDRDLLAAAERLWESAISTKTYLTGGQGSRHRDEAFGDAYELPPDRAYAETCAAIASFQLSWRLLLATGRARYADEMERVLHNGIAAGIGADGTSFFYSNPLQLRSGHDGSSEDAPSARLSWYTCSCCPPNLARLMASLHSYVASTDDTGVQVHLYSDAVIRAGVRAVEIRTRYPWEGRIAVTVRDSDSEAWTLALRIPAWCTDFTLEVDGAPVTAEAQDGYLRLTRRWPAGTELVLTLAMPARMITAHPHVDAVRGTVALLRGPIVYCLEHADLPGVVFEDVALDPAAAIAAEPGEPALIPVRLVAGGVRRESESGALYRPLAASGAPPAMNMPLTAIPYYLWANRGTGPMRVWLPLAGSPVTA
jgi:DUF1680 family protein